ncbi:MAG: 2-succinyl-5-enolpyruvyl-6-hydroxy-3-cyclohexene-1-carboxylic-acid synthase [Bradymonadia bacterium]
MAEADTSAAGVAEINAILSARIMAGLARGGVRHVVVSPGSRNTPLVLAAARGPFELHRIVDERVAGFFALGLARGAGAPVALICTSGSAGAHYLPALVEARQSHVPLVAITADRPADLQGLGAPQTVPQQGYFGPHAGFSAHIEAPLPGAELRWVGPLVARAVHAAPQVSHLNVAFHQPLWSPDVPAVAFDDAPVVVSATPQLGPAVLAEVARGMRARGPGVIVVGPMEHARGPRWAQAMARLADETGWPIIADPASQLRFEPALLDHPALVTTADVLARGAAVAPLSALKPAQALCFGRVPTSKHVARWLADACAGAMVVVDAYGDWHDPHAAAATLVVAEPIGFVEGLCEALADNPVPPPEGWVSLWAAAEGPARRVLALQCDVGDAGETVSLWEAAVAQHTLSAVPVGGIMHSASSMPIRDLDAFGAPEAAQGPIRVCVSRGANGIDGTFATALGEAVSTGVPVVMLVGDVATLHDVSGVLATAEVEAEINLTAVVVDNSGGGIFDFLPIAAGAVDGGIEGAYRRLFRTSQSVPAQAIGEVAGARTATVSTLAALDGALAEAVERCGVDLIVAKVPADGSNVARHQRAFDAALEVAAHAVARRLGGEA